ncbi:MAG: glycosyl hydrolase family 18 protein [Eubacteriales bacterium]
MKQQLLGYCETKSLHLMKEHDIKALDSIHIAFGLINDKGQVYWEADRKAMERIKGIKPNIQFILSIGGWAADGFSQAAATKEGRIELARSAVEILVKEELDGLDLDWEYPCIGNDVIHAMPEDKENFTLLLAEFREQLSELPTYKTLSIAAGGLDEYLEATNMAEVVTYLDYVQLMTYDFHNGMSTMTGHLANLYPSKVEPDAPNSDYAVRRFVEEGVPMNKIVMGGTFYGRVWSGLENRNNGLGVTGYPEKHDFYRYNQIVDLLQKDATYKRYFDEEAKACYLFNGDTFITYEDEETLRYKTAYVKENGMYGMMFWEYEQDQTYTLTTVLKKGLEE